MDSAKSSPGSRSRSGDRRTATTTARSGAGTSAAPGLSLPEGQAGLPLPQQHVTHKELADINEAQGKDLVRELLAAMVSGQTKSNQDTAVAMGGVIQAHADKHNARLDGHEARIEDIEQDHNEMQDLLSRHSRALLDAGDAIKRLEQRLGAAESGNSSEILANDEYDRAVDKTFLWIEAGDKKLVKLENLINSTAEWLEAAGINKDQYKYVGNMSKVAPRFKLKFKGIDGVAGTLAGRAIRALREDGEWRAMDCITTDTEGIDGPKVKIYVNTDKSPKTRRTEIATRDLTRILRSSYDIAAYPNKLDGTVTVKHIPIAQIMVDDANELPSIRWNAHGLAELDIKSLNSIETRQEIKDKVFKTVRSSSKIEWSV